MPNAEVLRAQTGPEDGALFEQGLVNTVFMPQNHMSYTDDIEEKLTDTKPTVQSGQELRFDIEKESTLLRDVDLIMTPQALALGAGGTYIRYCDWLGIAAIASVEWKYGGNSIQKYTTNDVVFSDVHYMVNEKKDIERYEMLGDTTAAFRNTYAAAPTRPIRCRIPSPWKDVACHSPLISGLANKLQLLITLQAAGGIVQSDGAKPAVVNYTNAYIDKRVIHFNGEVRSEYTALCNTPEGVSYLYDDIQTFNYYIPANTLGPLPYTVEVRDFDGPISRIDMLWRTQTQVATDGTSVPQPYEIDTTIIADLTLGLVSNSMRMADFEPTETDEPYRLFRFFNCDQTSLQRCFLWAEYPEYYAMSSGSINFSNFTNPRMLITSTHYNLNNPALVVTMIGRRHNWLVQQRGNLQRVWR